jgi:8-amino-7-oxononanoate carboxylating dehydrogenase
LGAGGIGMAAAEIISAKKELCLVAACDRFGYVYDAQGLDFDKLKACDKTVANYEGLGRKSDDAIGEIIKLGDKIDGILKCLPNLPNSFIPKVLSRFSTEGYKGVMVDVLKRTRAVEMIMEQDDELKQAGITYITGCGATPGILSAAANLASQSYMEVKEVEIEFGVGISNWEAYRATIREDIAHMEGFNVESAAALSDAEIEELLGKTNGKLYLKKMEHADDVLLEMAGVATREQVTVGGIVDTRNANKPVSTTMRLTGTTFDGQTGTHEFKLADEACMAANVVGPALGYIKAGKFFHDKGIYGVFGSTQVMPQFVK